MKFLFSKIGSALLLIAGVWLFFGTESVHLDGTTATVIILGLLANVFFSWKS